MERDLTYFILTRAIFESPIWSDDPHILKLFIYLIGTARHSKKPKRYPSFEIKRGELVTSLNRISDDNQYLGNGTLKRWSKQKVSRMLKVLVDQQYISLLSDTYGTHISIIHYDTYQDPNTYKSDTSGTPLEQVRNTSGTGVETNNNVNKGNNVENVKNESSTTSDQIKTPKIEFDKFWDLYDKKVGDKDKIKKKWDKLKLEDQEKTLKHLPDYKKNQPNKKFRKDPNTYLNNKAWNDEIIPNEFDFGSNDNKIEFDNSLQKKYQMQRMKANGSR